MWILFYCLTTSGAWNWSKCFHSFQGTSVSDCHRVDTRTTIAHIQGFFFHSWRRLAVTLSTVIRWLPSSPEAGTAACFCFIETWKRKLPKERFPKPLFSLCFCMHSGSNSSLCYGDAHWSSYCGTRHFRFLVFFRKILIIMYVVVWF